MLKKIKGKNDSCKVIWKERISKEVNKLTKNKINTGANDRIKVSQE